MKLDFRAWDKTRNEIVDVMDIDLSIKEVGVCNVPKRLLDGRLHTIHSVKRDWDEVELMQYTGLKDKNGVEIYEGDIVSNRYANFYTPIFRNGIYMAYNVDYLNLTEQEPSTQFNVVCKSGCKVIGNIYENPELLGVTK